MGLFYRLDDDVEVYSDSESDHDLDQEVMERFCAKEVPVPLTFPNRRMHLHFQSKFDRHIWSFPVIFLFSKAYIVLHINEFCLIAYIFSNVTVVSHSAKSDLIRKHSSNPINDLKTLIPFYSNR
jgi:hypothetical protein